MGYGIVLWLDDDAVRDRVATDGTERVAEALQHGLVEAVGTDDYPVTGLPVQRVGFWQRLGACYSSHLTGIEVTADGGRLLEAGAPLPPAPEGLWQPSLSSGAMARATSDALRHPQRLAADLGRHGGNLTDAVYGPNRVARRSLASLWWVYASCLVELWTAGGIGRAVLAGIDSHLEATASTAGAGGALRKAGSLLDVGPAGLVWSGNRICTADALTPNELPLLERRGHRRP